MNSDHLAPLFICHFVEGGVSENPGIVDEDVDSSKDLHSLINDLFSFGYGVCVSDHLCFKLLGELLGYGGCEELAVFPREIVNKHFGSFGGEVFGIFQTKTLSSPCYYYDLILKIYHVLIL